MGRYYKSVRTSDEIYNILESMTELYKDNFINNIKKSNFIEKVAIKGIPVFLYDLRERAEEGNKKEIIPAIIKNEEAFGKFLFSNHNQEKTKIFTFTADEMVHVNMEKIANAKNQLDFSNINSYNSVFNALLINGVKFQIDQIKNTAVFQKNNNIFNEMKEIEIYFNDYYKNIGEPRVLINKESNRTNSMENDDKSIRKIISRTSDRRKEEREIER